MKTPMPRTPLTMTVREVTELLGVSRSKLYYLGDTSSIYYDRTFPKRMRIGAGATRFDREAVMNWYAQQVEGTLTSASECDERRAQSTIT